MKQLTILALSFFLSFSGLMAQATVPEAAKQHFSSQHPDAQDVEWEMEINGYEVEYKIDGVEYEAIYDNDGQLMHTKQEIEERDLPGAIVATIQRDYADREIDDPDRYTYPDGRVAYKVELEHDDDVDFDAWFNENGTLIEIER
jgi:hypothetical protein